MYHADCADGVLEDCAALSSPASWRPFRARKTATTSLITAAAAMVPRAMSPYWLNVPVRDEIAMPVKTRETPECGMRVSPRYLRTVTGAWDRCAPMAAPPLRKVYGLQKYRPLDR